ncbi:hypothetical protein N480_20885 [Pseudoalteromonas luteoviolacea S2607]|uniref:hypothetical protein n=1 Tax=Pseudoalteromonas luteoviolacea TaxID=43657 RepID=UPI0007B04974|nr:hypothetical protein [Pseudoalteromonas luteoviolacea]KZN34742.1 hypothetical protein N480_20885 [Pseudoalteromonas luteoviolacea S2607]
MSFQIGNFSLSQNKIVRSKVHWKTAKVSMWLMAIGINLYAVHAAASSSPLNYESSGSVLLSDQFAPSAHSVSLEGSPLDVERERLYSIDFESTITRDAHTWFMWLEYSRNPSEGGVSSWFGNTNEDAATTEDGRGTSRTQLSSLYWQYTLPNSEQQVLLGLAEVSMLVDTNDVANDEVGQFMTAGFVNNPSIDFPDYAPALRYQGVISDETWRWRLLLSSAKGLAGNQGNYAETFSQIDGSDGVFTTLEGQRQLANNTALTFGSWHNSDTKRHGVYSAFHKEIGDIQLHSRLGHSRSYQHAQDDEALDKTHFASLSGQYTHQAFTLAAGASFIGNKSSGGQTAVTRMVECYVKYDWSENLHTTVAAQWHDGVVNSDEPGVIANWQNVMTLRTVLHW